MINFKKILLIGLFIISSSVSYAADDPKNTDLIQLLVVAKSTGMCGSMKQMVAFQETTKMTGGDEFVMRFLNMEAARLGQTLEDFLKQCESSIAIYSNTMKALGYE